MSNGAVVSWSDLTSWRAEAHRRFGSILDLPIVAIDRELRRILADAPRVLDVGAGSEHPLRAMIDAERTEYRSLDPGPSGEFDSRHVSEIPPDLRFEAAVANQVLEHVNVEEALEIVRGVAGVLAPGGRFVATVPNAGHPVRQWADATHVTAWGLYDFYGLFRSAGLEVDTMSRYGKRRLSFRPGRRYIVKVVAQEFRVDWCDSILVVARRAA